MPGRFLVHSGDLIEVDAESFSLIQKVSLFLLNDSLMIALLMPHRSVHQHSVCLSLCLYVCLSVCLSHRSVSTLTYSFAILVGVVYTAAQNVLGVKRKLKIIIKL